MIRTHGEHSPVAFLDDLAKNASAHNISVVIYSGNDDSLVPHWSSEGEKMAVFLCLALS
jgi:hypothetical protein